MNAEALAVEDITVHLGGVEILKQVSFGVKRGESFGIIGPNGAGKTTVLNVISGVVLPTAGRVMFDGAALTGQRPYKARAHGIGRSLQTTAYFHDLTALELVSLAVLPNTVRGAMTYTAHRQRFTKGRAASQATAALADLGLEEFAHRRLGDLSSAMQKLVDLARAVLAGRNMLLLDEPTSGVSSHERIVISQTLRRMRDEGRTVLVIDHDPGFVTANCDRLMALNFGQVLKVGYPDEVMTDPVVKRSYLGESDDESEGRPAHS